MALETPSRPPPPMANAIVNFHFDYLTPSLMQNVECIICNVYFDRNERNHFPRAHSQATMDAFGQVIVATGHFFN